MSASGPPGWWDEAVGGLVAAGLLGLPAAWVKWRKHWWAWALGVLWIVLVGAVVYYSPQVPLWGLLFHPFPGWSLAVALLLGILVGFGCAVILRRQQAAVGAPENSPSTEPAVPAPVAELAAGAPRVIIGYTGPGIFRRGPERLTVSNESDAVALHIRLEPLTRGGDTIDFPVVDMLRAHQEQELDLGGKSIHSLLEREAEAHPRTEEEAIESLEAYAKLAPVEVKALYGGADGRRYRSILRFRYDRITEEAKEKDAWVENAGDGDDVRSAWPK